MASSPKPRRAPRSHRHETEAPAPPSPDVSDGNVASRKLAWSRRSEASTDTGPVMGASSWPALSESARSSPKSPASDLPPEAAMFTNPAPGNMPQESGSEIPDGVTYEEKLQKQSIPEKISEDVRVSPREFRSGSSEHHSRAVPVHGSGRGEPHHRGYGGGHRRGNHNSGGGGGIHYDGRGGRRDMDRVNQEWNSHQNFVPMPPPQRPMHRPPFLRAPIQGPAPFMGPPSPMQPFGAPMGFHDMPPMILIPAPPPLPVPETYRAVVPYIRSPAMFVPPDPDPETQSKLQKQIEYYFSPENLCKDIFLRNNMNGEGWVSVHLIAGFNRVKQLTSNIQLILESVRNSPELEVEGEKIRRRNDWRAWLIWTAQSASNRGFQDSNANSLSAEINNMSLGEGSTGQYGMRTQVIDRSSSGPLKNQSATGNTVGDGNNSIAEMNSKDLWSNGKEVDD